MARYAAQSSDMCVFSEKTWISGFILAMPAALNVETPHTNSRGELKSDESNDSADDDAICVKTEAPPTMVSYSTRRMAGSATSMLRVEVYDTIPSNERL